MLTLSRKSKQQLNLHTAEGIIRVAVIPRRGSNNEFQVTIDAPASVTILRAEIDPNNIPLQFKGDKR